MQPQIESYDIFLKTYCCLLGTEEAFLLNDNTLG